MRPLLPRILIALALYVVLAAGAAHAVPKTDVVVMPNGDRITCEIKGMSYGKLTAKTSDMGTIYIKWDKIESIRSVYWFRLRTHDGHLYYGQIQEGDIPRTLIVKFRNRETLLPFAGIVEIQPVRQNFWNKLNFSIGVGYNWTQANEQKRFTFDTALDYTGRTWSWGFAWSTIHTEIEDKDPYRRFDGNLYLQRVISGRWFGMANSTAQRNDELGLALRLSGALSLGYYLVQASQHELQVTAGISQNREWSTAEDQTENNVEAPFRLDYRLYHYDSPKTELRVRGGYMPSLTSNRYRFDADIAGRQEVVSDLFVELKYYISYDSSPPPGAASKKDSGVTFGVGWSK